MILSLDQRLFGWCRRANATAFWRTGPQLDTEWSVSRLSFRLRRLMLGCEPREGSNDTNARERPCSSSNSSIFPTNMTERT